MLTVQTKITNEQNLEQ